MKLNLREMCLILWIKPFRNTTLRRKVGKLLGIVFLKFIQFLIYYMYRMGLPESSLKPFSFLPHCKLSCDSPCCVKIRGEDNHCNINIDTHEHISDSEEEQIDKQ